MLFRSEPCHLSFWDLPFMRVVLMRYTSSFGLFVLAYIERGIALPAMAPRRRQSIVRYVLQEQFSFSPPWVCSVQREYASAGVLP